MTVTWMSIQRAIAARRRLVAALLAGVAVLCALTALRPASPPTVLVLAAARDLHPGAALSLADLRSVALPATLVPEGALRPGAAVLGRLVAGPVRRGEALTDVRLVGPGLLAELAPGHVAVPVRFADAGALALLSPGDRIDVLAAPTAGFAAPAEVAAPAADISAGHPAAPGSAPGGVPPSGGVPPAGGARGSPGRPPPGAAASPDGQPGTGARVVAPDVLVVTVAADDPSAFGGGALVVVACTPAVARALASAATDSRLSPALRVAAPP